MYAAPERAPVAVASGASTSGSAEAGQTSTVTAGASADRCTCVPSSAEAVPENAGRRSLSSAPSTGVATVSVAGCVTSTLNVRWSDAPSLATASD